MESGNQQERLTSSAYLAGIVDGEGHIGLLVQRGQRVKGGLQYKPVVQVQMQSPETIEHLAKISAFLEVPHYVYHWKFNKSRWIVLGMKRTLVLLPHIRPFLFTKATQADLIKEFAESRLAAVYGSGWSERELEIYETLKSLNSR